VSPQTFGERQAAIRAEAGRLVDETLRMRAEDADIRRALHATREHTEQRRLQAHERAIVVSCAVRVRGDVVVLALCGEFDLAGVRGFELAVDEALRSAPGRLLVDLTDLEFIDSSGLRSLLRLQTRLDATTQLELAPGPNRVQRVFEAAGLAAALPFGAAQREPGA
jgi:anti-sigma B factor antagonist